MKKFLLFLLGVICGVIGTFVFAFLVLQSENNNELIGLKIFETPTQCITKSNLKILQVIEPNKALATKEEFDGLFVLLVNSENKFYYDNEIIKIPKGQCAKQIGIYNYETKEHNWKTVPVVDINLK